MTENQLNIRDNAPNFVVKNKDGEFSLSQIDKNIVLYFYPKDNTPGCTVESQGFAALNEEFNQHDTIIVGISKDSEKSHDKFKEKFNLPFDLISDPETSVCQNYSVWKMKSFMGRKYMGISRETFLIGKDKKIKHIWRDVKVKTHALEVLEEVKKL